MQKTILLIVILINSIGFSAQEMPYKMAPLPVGTKFEFAGKIEMFENSETIIYNVNVNEKSHLISISTEGLPNVILIPKNAYGGGELYRKLENEDYVRIIECRKNGDTIDIYKINADNTSTKIFGVHAGDDVAGALMVGYRLYWSNLHDKLFNKEDKINFKTVNKIKVPIDEYEISLDKEMSELGLYILIMEKEENIVMITSDQNEKIKNIEEYSNYINEKNIRNISKYGLKLKLIKSETGLFKSFKSINEIYNGSNGTEDVSVKSITFMIDSFFYSICYVSNLESDEIIRGIELVSE
jgi:hypothetical protein